MDIKDVIINEINVEKDNFILIFIVDNNITIDESVFVDDDSLVAKYVFDGVLVIGDVSLVDEKSFIKYINSLFVPYLITFPR